MAQGMKTYIVTVDRPWATEKVVSMGRPVFLPVSSMSDSEFSARFDAVAAAVRGVVAREGGKLHALFNQVGSMSVETTDAGKALIEKIEHVRSVFANEDRFRSHGSTDTAPSPGLQ